MKSMSRPEHAASQLGARASMTSTQTVRDVNSSVVLEQFWQAPVDTGLTATELVESTGLTRSTVLAISDELREAGWLLEDRAPSTIPGRGRQARRFTFNKSLRLVVGSDIGFRSVTSIVADLKGTVLARVSHRFDGREFSTDRTSEVLETINEALRSAEVSIDDVGSACFGFAAPLDRNGVPFAGNPYWDAVRIDLARVHAMAPGWSITVENDADLAAIAEMHLAEHVAGFSSITLLAGEWLGAGIVVNGELFRGANGGAGEMAYLERVVGVESSWGPSAVVRNLVLDAIALGEPTTLKADASLPFEAIVTAAQAGDALAVRAIAQLQNHLALTVASLSSFLDPGTVIFAGGNAPLLAPLLGAVRAQLAELVPYPPELICSELGSDTVLLGAVHSAITAVQGTALSS